MLLRVGWVEERSDGPTTHEVGLANYLVGPQTSLLDPPYLLQIPWYVGFIFQNQ
jgi:hypothetical protein